MTFEHDDAGVVVVIGSGAGGATVARELCERGIGVVLLEAGPRIEAAEFRNDEFFAYQQLTWFDKRIASGDWPAARYAQRHTPPKGLLEPAGAPSSGGSTNAGLRRQNGTERPMIAVQTSS